MTNFKFKKDIVQIKRTFLLLPFLFLSLPSVNAQRTINHPAFGTRINTQVELNKIILSDSATILCVEFSHFEDELTEIPSTYFIKTNTGEKLSIKSALPSKVNETVELDSRIHFKHDGK